MEDCLEGKESGHYLAMGKQDQKYLLSKPRLSPREIRVGCSLQGETLFQQRFFSGGEVSFTRGWQDYVDGFGTDSRHWLGLQNLWYFTNSKSYDLGLYFHLINETRISYPRYSGFRLTENVTYTASLGPPIVDMSALGDHLKGMNGQRFSTYDNDNDNSTTRNCAMEYGAGWWFNACAEANFNGRMSDTGVRENVLDEMFWEGLNTIPKSVSLKLINRN
nr:hypothetical protein BaRGS_001285 [Batillaria attramentaria]